MEKIAAALAWLKQGGLVIVADDETREAEGDLIGIAEYVTAESVNFMTTHGRGLICAPISQQIATDLQLPVMTTHNTDAFGTAFTISVDYQTTSTGISANDRAVTIQKLADATIQPTEFYRPGHIFPLIAKEGGVLERRGHTEAAVDLARLTHSRAAAYICEILKPDGTMARLTDLQKMSQEWGLPLLTIEELAIYRQKQQPISVTLPTELGKFNMSLYEEQPDKEHIVLTKGDLTQITNPVLVRLHSECLTGDVFGSHRCDCGEQLHRSMAMIEEAGQGVVIYLRQEGRGIGLKNKLRAYQLQEAGMDTYEANVALGFAPDERTYEFAADILTSLGLSKIKLITNNPQKVEALTSLGIEVVERVPLEIPAVKENRKYLKTKKTKFHHYLSI